MANRSTLHISKLEEFKKWLVKDGWEIEEPKGIYEVLRARKRGRQNPLIVYKKADAKEHLSVMDRDSSVVLAFIRDCKKPKTQADRIRAMTDEELAELLDSVDNGGVRALDVDYPCDECSQRTKCDGCFLEWLQSEVEE